MDVFEPKIIAFLCNWCAYEGADAAGRARLNCPAQAQTVRVMCSGRISPELILEAFRLGADGVLVLGCPPGTCHYANGNVHTQKRIILLKTVLAPLGVSAERLILDWVSAGEGEKYVHIVEGMVNKVKALGPLIP